jgi:hypothetical protein
MRFLSGRTAIVAAAVAATASITTALAVNLTSTPQIQACVHKQTGAVRIVASVDLCNQAETPLSWNQEGVAGPLGPRGPSDAW